MEDFTLFTHMIHPETGERIPINTLETKRLLRQYVSQYNTIKRGGVRSRRPRREKKAWGVVRGRIAEAKMYQKRKNQTKVLMDASRRAEQKRKRDPYQMNLEYLDHFADRFTMSIKLIQSYVLFRFGLPMMLEWIDCFVDSKHKHLANRLIKDSKNLLQNLEQSLKQPRRPSQLPVKVMMKNFFNNTQAIKPFHQSFRLNLKKSSLISNIC